MERFVVISGCSGGGKSTLVAELVKHGHTVVEEPGRRIVREALARDAAALPWADGTAFARRAIPMALADWKEASLRSGWVFFERGLIDAAAALLHLTGPPALGHIGWAHRYHRRVFLTPPWPEIFALDLERRHSLDTAIAEYDRLLTTYPSLGYEIITLPKIGVPERADFVLRILAD